MKSTVTKLPTNRIWSLSSPNQPATPHVQPTNMADDAEAIHAAELKKKRQFRKYSYRGVDLEDLLDKSSEEVPSMIL